MASEAPLRVALTGQAENAVDVEAQLRFLAAFELVEELESAEVVVVAHDSTADPAVELAAVREHTRAPVVLATATSSAALVRWALDAGIADVLTLPAAPEATLFAIEKAARVARETTVESEGGRVLTVFSPKGGSGKSVVATNLAAAAAARGRRQTLLVDLDLQFGDAAIMLGLEPSQTVRELTGTPTDLDAEKLEVYTERHATGLRVLPAPMNPEDAELVGEDAVRALLEVARAAHDVVVVDTAPFFYGPMLATLDLTDRLLVICTPDLPTLKNVRLALKTLELLAFPQDKVTLVLNRASSASGLERGDVEAALGRRVDHVLPLDAGVPLAVNQAVPAALGKSAPLFAPALLELARTVVGPSWAEPKPATARSARLFSLGRS